MNKRICIEGLVAATPTPFHADGTLNPEAVEKLAGHLWHHRMSAVFITGTTGEGHSLTVPERRALAVRWSEVLRGTSMKLLVHVGHHALPAARELAAHAQQVGAHAIAALAPSYFKPPDLETLVRWCAEIAAGAPELPFYFYDIPAWTGVSFSMPEFLRLGRAHIPTLAGLKFTNFDLGQFQQCLRVEGGVFDILYGCDESLLAAWALGARGAVGSSYNFAAPIYHRARRAFESGDWETARREQARAGQLIQVLARHGYLAAAKWLLTRLGVPVGPVRLPLRALTSAQQRILEGELEAIGFFDWIKDVD